MLSIHADGAAVVTGATGGVGRALVATLRESGRFSVVLALSRSSNPAFDVESEGSIREAAKHAAERGEIRLLIDAIGFLHGDGFEPEKSWRGLDASHMAKAFAVNANRASASHEALPAPLPAHREVGICHAVGQGR
jgi:uncharacterized protein YbjT (DUF2867 family)